MQRAKAFFVVCAGIFLLALAYHLGAQSAAAQAPGNPVVALFATNEVITANGDVYRGSGDPCQTSLYVRCGNIFGNGPVPTTHETLGGVKVKYR